MSEKVREFWIGKSISGWTAVEFLKAYGIIAPNQETTIHVIEKSAYDRLFEINKVLVEALERTQKILRAYSDVKVESPHSSPNEEYLAFKGYGMNKEVLEKAKEMGK